MYEPVPLPISVYKTTASTVREKRKRIIRSIVEQANKLISPQVLTNS
jgi:hypothetical protein